MIINRAARIIGAHNNRVIREVLLIVKVGYRMRRMGEGGHLMIVEVRHNDTVHVYVRHVQVRHGHKS